MNTTHLIFFFFNTTAPSNNIYNLTNGGLVNTGLVNQGLVK